MELHGWGEEDGCDQCCGAPPHNLRSLMKLAERDLSRPCIVATDGRLRTRLPPGPYAHACPRILIERIL